MVGVIFLDESLLILIFVCFPLTLGLAVFLGIAIRNWRRTRFPIFPVKINRVGREQVYVLYSTGERVIEFDASEESNQSIVVYAPMELPNEELATTVPGLTRGLEMLGYQYMICRRGLPRN